MIDPTVARDRAAEILRRSEFQEPEPGRLRQLWTWILDWLGELFDIPFVGGGGGGVGTLLVWVILAAAAGFLVWVIVRAQWRVDRGSSDPSKLSATTIAGKTAAEWDAIAADAEAAGNWGPAVRARYRALVARLADRRLVRVRPGSTSGEHRSDVADRWPVGEGSFTPAAERFDEVWYGGRDAGPDDVEELRRLARLADDAKSAGARGRRG